MTLKDAIAAAGLSQSELARQCHVSPSTITNVVYHHVPATWYADLRQRIKRALTSSGKVTDKQAEQALAAIEKKPLQQRERARLNRAINNHNRNHLEDFIVIQKQTLAFETRRAFGLPMGLFEHPQTEDAIYISPYYRFVRETLLDAAKNCNFLALVGESGSGKTVAVDGFKEYVRQNEKSITIIEPSTIGMTSSVKKGGKSLSPRDIAESIYKTLAGDEASTPSSSEQLYRSIRKLLLDGADIRRRYVVLIEEAHDIPKQTLKALKRLLEMRDGMRRLLGVVLVGQTELERLLASADRTIREVAQRCDVVKLPPLRTDFTGYLRFSLERKGVDFDALFAPEAIDTMQDALVVGRDSDGKNGVDIGYPLAAANLAIACLNMAATCGEKQVSADIVREAIKG